MSANRPVVMISRVQQGWYTNHTFKPLTATLSASVILSMSAFADDDGTTPLGALSGLIFGSTDVIIVWLAKGTSILGVTTSFDGTSFRMRRDILKNCRCLVKVINKGKKKHRPPARVRGV